MYDTILVPYDGSDEAVEGAHHAIDLAAALGASIHALYVMDLPGAPRALSIRDDEEQMREEYREYGETVTTELAEMAADSGVETTSVVRPGSVSEEIVNYADENPIDAIVLGSAYHGKIGAILGSTADKVVRTATVPVIVNRLQADDI